MQADFCLICRNPCPSHGLPFLRCSRRDWAFTHLYGLARQACFTIGKEPSVNKANDPPEQKVKAADQASLRRHSGYPDKAFSSFLGVTSCILWATGPY